MLLIRTRIKKTLRKYPLRKKVHGVRKTSNDKKIYVWSEDVMQKKDGSLNIITLFPN
jgi:hypothetical protein